MGLSVGELFVNLGIKGSEKTIGAISSTAKGLGEASHMALETKAAILAAVYAFGRLVEESGAVGTNLTNFNAITGVTVQQLQKYQYAARQMGASNEDVASSFQTLQANMSKFLLTGQGPAGLGFVESRLGTNIRGNIARYMKDPTALLQLLQKYADSEKNVGLRNETLKSFGLSDPILAAMARGAFRPEVMAKQRPPAYSNAEIASLDRANIGWSNLITKLDMASGHLNAQFGPTLVKALSQVVDQVAKLAAGLEKLAERYKVFGLITDSLKGLSAILDHINGPEKKEFVGPTRPGETHKRPGWLEGILPGIHGSSIFIPQLTHPHGSGGSEVNNTVTQNLIFQHDGRDANKVGDSAKKGAQEALRMSQLGLNR